MPSCSHLGRPPNSYLISRTLCLPSAAHNSTSLPCDLPATSFHFLVLEAAARQQSPNPFSSQSYLSTASWRLPYPKKAILHHQPHCSAPSNLVCLLSFTIAIQTYYCEHILQTHIAEPVCRQKNTDSSVSGCKYTSSRFSLRCFCGKLFPSSRCHPKSLSCRS